MTSEKAVLQQQAQQAQCTATVTPEEMASGLHEVGLSCISYVSEMAIKQE